MLFSSEYLVKFTTVGHSVNVNVTCGGLMIERLVMSNGDPSVAFLMTRRDARALVLRVRQIDRCLPKYMCAG